MQHREVVRQLQQQVATACQRVAAAERAILELQTELGRADREDVDTGVLQAQLDHMTAAVTASVAQVEAERRYAKAARASEQVLLQKVVVH